MQREKTANKYHNIDVNPEKNHGIQAHISITTVLNFLRTEICSQSLI